jgi:hypothetical protein
LRTLAIAVQLALFLFVIERRFQIESPAFREVVRWAAGGFLVHAFLPRRHRLPFFALLSVAVILRLLGAAAGAWVVALGLALLGICHLPAPFATRVVLLLLAGAALAAARGGALPSPVPGVVWPVLGAMFMFRMIVYAYDLRHVKEPVSPWARVSYFFLLPNVCFPLFPVVDWRTFLRTYHDTEEHRIHQKGMQWMFRGLVHLVLYRLVYYRFTLPMEQVSDLADLGRFLLANYALYLRISGQFHLVVGMLGLFGFNLPETNRLYFLASGFSDYWRRINIYWKDFMVKVFYYPAFFRLRGLGPTRALVVATACVFAVTWALHSWQWFWLRGDFPVTGPDLAFWALLGLFVVWNSLKEAKGGRRRSLGTRTWTLGESFRLALRTVGMQVAICALWSLWTSTTLSEWSALWIVGEPGWTGGWQIVAGVLAAAIAAGTLVRYFFDRVGRLRVAGSGLVFRRSVAATAGALLLLAALGNRHVAARLPAGAADLMLSLRRQRLNEGDLARLTRGYYEGLLGADRMGSQLWELTMREPPGWYGEIEVMYRDTGDFLGREHVPGARSVAKGLPVAFNRFGMPDRDYAKEKPAGTFRVALVGDSYAVGLGIPPDSTWEARVEARLSAAPPAGYGRAEILNFSVGGYRTVQRVYAAESRALDFSPDAVFFLCHENDLASLKDLSDALREGVPVPYAPLAEMGARANVGPRTPEAAAERRLQKIGEEIVGWTYRRAVEVCRAHGAVPVWLFMRTTTEGEWRDAHAALRRLAEEAGFVILDLEDTYGDVPVKSIFLAEWDQHPDVRGHRILADRLWREIEPRRDRLAPPRPAPVPVTQEAFP